MGPSLPTAWHSAFQSVANPATMDNRLDGYGSIGCYWPGGGPPIMCSDIYFLGSREDFQRVFLDPLNRELNITDFQNDGTVGISRDYIYYFTEYSGGYYSYASGGGEGCQNVSPGSDKDYVCNTLGYPSANGIRQDAQTGAGLFTTTVSWIAPARLFNRDDPAASDAFFSDPAMQQMSGHLIGGSLNNVGASDTAVHPGMRSSAFEMLRSLPVCDGTNDATCKAEDFQASLNRHVPPPATGPIFNHDGRNLNALTPVGQAHGMNWQQMYWGSNLPRLQQIKAKVDPYNVFTCRNCITPQLSAGYDNTQGW